MIFPYPDLHVRIEGAIAKLRSLRDGAAAVVDLMACGPTAIAPLAAFLVAREPSGIFLPRCQAAEALTALGAKSALLDFLRHPARIIDPVEETGEDVVISAVARGLRHWQDEEVFAVLMNCAARKILPGLIEALGDYRRLESLPYFAKGLAEDGCRSETEEALRGFDPSIAVILLQWADQPVPARDDESESSRRARRSALKLFGELDSGLNISARLWFLAMREPDPWITLTACSIMLGRIGLSDGDKVGARLVSLLGLGDWRLAAEAEDLLVRHYSLCGSAVEACRAEVSGKVAASIRRVLAQARPEMMREVVHAQETA
ncbi:hypothetical protein GALL_275190 [mine drainage metagenome]|uniref:DUF2336 domain-containing protein n=1 Tax=mine drainage metagenome TaxID=410659 RepID=A0A1J5R3Q7_9ZZZZ